MRILIILGLMSCYTFSQETITEGMVTYKHETYEIWQDTTALINTSLSKTYFKAGWSRKAYYDHRFKANMIYIYDHNHKKGLSLMELSDGRKYYSEIDHSGLSKTSPKDQEQEHKHDKVPSSIEIEEDYVKDVDSKQILGYQCKKYSSKILGGVTYEEGYTTELIGPTVGLEDNGVDGIKGLRLYWERKSLNYKNGMVRTSKGIYHKSKKTIVEAIEITAQQLDDTLFSLIPPKSYIKITQNTMIRN